MVITICKDQYKKALCEISHKINFAYNLISMIQVSKECTSLQMSKIN